MITLELFEMKLMRILKWLIAILIIQMKCRTSLMRNHEDLSLGRSYPDKHGFSFNSFSVLNIFWRCCGSGIYQRPLRSSALSSALYKTKSDVARCLDAKIDLCGKMTAFYSISPALLKWKDFHLGFVTETSWFSMAYFS